MSANAAMSLDRYGASLQQGQTPAAVSGQPWLVQQRREAIENLQRLGFPQRREEAWRYTSVDRLLKHDFMPAGDEIPDIDTGKVRLPGFDAHLVVFVNGRFAPGLSDLGDLPPGVTVGSLRRQIEQNPILPARWLGKAAGAPAHAFSALNTATLEDGLFIHIARGQQPQRPIEVLHLTTASEQAVLAQTRCLVLLEAGARATLVEHFHGTGPQPYFNNGLSEIVLQDDAMLEHYRLQEESPAAFHLHSLFVNQQARSHYRNSGYALGGAWSRTELTIDFLDEGAATELDGLYLAGEQQLTDVHVDIRHAVPGCSSNTRYRGLLHGKGRAVFDGRIEVREHAGGSVAHLNNANLLLSRQAEVDTKPQLEIYTDDVQCSHGATVGQLDPAQLFYLRSRGIDTPEARRLLCLGFAAEVIGQCPVAPLRERVEAGVSGQLATIADAAGGS
jgi:Fe-S cluster assembly protein SufD